MMEMTLSGGALGLMPCHGRAPLYMKKYGDNLVDRALLDIKLLGGLLNYS